MIGSCVSHYRIREKLGAGGMGEVYAAEDTHLGRRVAVKFPSLGGSAELLSRFLIEARAASRLDHPNIARIYDYGEAPDGRPFLVMELIGGTNLRDHLKGGPLSPALAVKVTEGVLRALREAHRNGLVHRDIKPSNVMLTAASEVKVLDFGLAKEILQAATGNLTQATTAPMGVTRAGANPGSPGYMSPEQARGSLLDGRSDLFSAGLVLYECLTGKRAFSGANMQELLAAEPPAPSSVAAAVPAALDRITCKALEKNPGARYQTADEMLDDLASASAEQSRTASRLVRSAVVGMVGSRRRRVLTALAGLAVLAVAIWVARRGGPHGPSPEALRWYERGTAALRDGTYYRAARALEQAVKLDPGYALAHARLAEACNELDDSATAKDEMLRARGTGTAAPRGLDGMYMDAILRTITGDYSGAIQTYNTLLQRAPDGDKAAVLVDLGRAFERNGETGKALDSFRGSARRDSQNAAAHLRAAIVLGRQQNVEAAKEFGAAESIYQAASNTEGYAEVLYQRAAWASANLRRLPEAREALEKAIQLSRAIGTEYQEIAATLQLSVVSYQGGDAAKAEEIASAAVERAKHAGMSYLAGRGLTDLGSARFLKGEYEKAETNLREALELARRFRMRRIEARSLFLLGSLHQQKSLSEDSLKEVEPALGFYRQAGFRYESLRCLALIARAQRDLGREGEALKSFQEQLSLAQAIDDRQMMGLAEQGIGSVLVLQERWPEALAHYERNQGISQSLNNRDAVIRALLSRARISALLGRAPDAERLFDEAEAQVVSGATSAPTRASIAMRRAATALIRGRYAEAQAKARQTWEGASADPATRADAKCVVGLALVRSGSPRPGRSVCQECVTATAALTSKPGLAEARMALAEAQIVNGEPAAAQDLIRQAIEFVDDAGHKESGWRAWALAAWAARASGAAGPAKEAAAKASARLADLRGLWSAADFEHYLTRPDIRVLLNQIK